MKISLRKKFASFITSIICISSFSTVMPVSAASDYDTYRLYFDVNKNSGVCVCNVNFSYNDFNDVKSRSSIFKVGNLGDTLHVGGGRTFGVGYYKNDNGNIVDSGTLFTATMGTKKYIWDTFTEFSMYLKDKDDNVLNSSLVKIDTVLVGDANGDGFVNNSDVTAIYNYLTDSTVYPLNSFRSADTNNDGIVDFTDAVNIYNYLNGQLEGFYNL